MYSDARSTFSKEHGENVASQQKKLKRAIPKKTIRIKGFKVKRCFGLLSMTSSRKEDSFFFIPNKIEGSLQRIEEKRAMRCFGEVYPYKSGLSTTA